MYIRYIDDILVLWKDEKYIDELAKDFTMDEYGLKLMKDHMTENNVHFLDLQLEKQDGWLKTSVYRKPTYRPVLIPEWSRDTMSYKKAVFRSFFNRTLSYSSTEEYLKKEIDYIMKVGMIHGYNKMFLLQVYRQVEERMKRKEKPKEEGRKYVPIPYHLKNLNVMKKIEKKNKVKLAPKRIQYYSIYYVTRKMCLSMKKKERYIRYR